MPFVSRNPQGRIVSLHDTPSPEVCEHLPLDAPELLEFAASAPELLAAKEQLSASDVALVRVLEDLIDLLVANNLIRFSDLPLAAQQKLARRESIRSKLQSLGSPIVEEGELF